MVSVELDARNTTPPPRFEVKAPEGAPNVLIALIDDMGFGMPSAYGGPIHMPTANRRRVADLDDRDGRLGVWGGGLSR